MDPADAVAADAVAVIPARGGSKRIPRKNVREFCGEPMIARPVRAALESGCFAAVVVSTDDEEIARVARAAGAQVPFMRPAALADDVTPTIPVIRHAIDALPEAIPAPGAVCCIYATSPFLRPEDIRRGRDALLATGCDFALSVTAYAFPVQRALTRAADGTVAMMHPENFAVRSQDLEEAWHDAGQFYWGTVAAWRAHDTIFTGRARGVALPRSRVQDIDTPEDWEQAEAMFRALGPG